MEFHAGILSPAFVDAHAHLELSYLKGAIPSGGGYAAFASAMGSVRNGFDEAQRLAAAAEADREMWNEGIEAVGDIVNDPSSFAVKIGSRIRYRSFAEVFGLRECNLERQRELLHNPLTSLTPHSVYSVQDAPFREVCNDGSDAPLSIHFMESPEELLLFFGRGALYDWYEKVGFRCDFLHYGLPAERIVECIPKERSVMLVHDCYVTQTDIDIIMNHFTAPVHWVLCPRSNRYISGIEPRTVGLLRANGLNICIGTDSLASNGSLSMVEELKCFAGIPLDELLTWATANGAAALDFGDTLGRAEVGKRCGLTLISGADLATMTLTDTAKATRLL